MIFYILLFGYIVYALMHNHALSLAFGLACSPIVAALLTADLRSN